MKYKNIYAAIHNFGHSFLSLVNYVDGDYVIDDLARIHTKAHDIEIDWLTNAFVPRKEATSRIIRSVNDYAANLEMHLHSHQVDMAHLQTVKFYWPAKGRKFMWAEDDRGKTYKIYVSEIK